MKNILKRVVIFIFSVIISLFSIITVYAEAVVDSFNATSYTISSVPIHIDTEFNAIKTVDGKYVYCLQFNKKPPYKKIVYSKDSLIQDVGMNYLLKKAYGIKTDEEYFIYKSAIWLYMIDKDIMEGSHYTLNDYYKNVKKSNTTEAKQILELIENAKKATATDNALPIITVNTDNVTFKLSDDKNYYISSSVNVISSIENYDVELTSAPLGSSIEKNNQGFIVKIPVDKVNELVTNITFNVKNSKEIYTAYKYVPNNSNYQPIANVFKEIKTATTAGKLKLENSVSIPILKVDSETGKPISGAELKLIEDSTGNVVKSWISTEGAEIITGLKAGNYTLTEVKAPIGYKEIEKNISFSIDSKGNILDANDKKIIEIIVTNELKTGSVLISKQDVTTGEELSGATLVVKDANGNVIEEWVSTNEPHYIEKMKPGTYTLTEIIAPEGYILSEETKEFTIRDDGTVTKVVIHNAPISEEEIPVEPTSSFKTVTSSFIGTMIIIVGIYLIIKNIKKKEFI